MREIKYRQALFLNGKFQQWHYWGFMEQYGALTFVGPETHRSTIEGARKNSQDYTGLKDKTGREIYEGDVVKFTDAITDREFTAPIVFNSCCYRADTLIGLRAFYDNPEVIGNVWENPELLEAKP